jgi:hypothetical protein
MCQIPGVFNACTYDLCKSAEEMNTRGWELVATNEPTVITEPFLDAAVVEDGKRDRGFPDSRCTDESKRFQGFSELDNLPDYLITPETGQRRGRNLSERDAKKT